MKKLYEGVRIIDFSTNIAGPVGTATMADFGAEVIKVEPPVKGEPTRMVNPMLEGYSFASWWLNHGKKSVTLDMRDPEGMALAKKIIADSDILVEGYRPGTMAKMGLSYEDVKKIKPDIIYVSVSMYGQTGKDSLKPGYDMLAQARAGLLDISGELGGIPIKCGFYISDYCTSTHVYAAMASALYHKARTGEGQWIDISLLDCLLSYNSNIELAALDMYPTRMGNHSLNVSPCGLFEGSNNQFLAINGVTNNSWETLCQLMGTPEYITDERYDQPFKRAERKYEVAEIIETWLKTFEDIHVPYEKILNETNMPCALVYNTKDILNDEHLLSRGSIAPLETPSNIKSFDKYMARGIVIRMSETPGKMEKAPYIGEHNEEVLTRYADVEYVRALEKKWEDAYYAKQGGK